MAKVYGTISQKGVTGNIVESGFSREAYWTTRYISALTIVPTGTTTQTIIAVIVGTGYDGISWEYSTDGIIYSIHGTSLTGTYPVTGLSVNTLYYWRARLYKGVQYSPYSNVDFDYTNANTKLLAGYKLEDSSNANFFNHELADYGVHPLMSESGIYYNGKTYIVYHGNDCDPYIITYTHATGVWATPVKVGTNSLANTNNHGIPSMLIDSAGFIHVLFDGYNSAIQYSKSNNSEDISAWTAQASPATGTYPQFVKFSDNSIYVFFRAIATPQDWGYIKSTDDCATWGAYVSVFQDYSYCKFQKGQGDFIHVGICGNNTIASFDRYHVYYAYFDSTNWKNILGTTLTIPLDITDAADIKVHDTGTNYVPNVAVAFDALNKPYVYFNESIAAAEISTYNYKIAKHNGVSWDVISMGVSTDRFQDFASAIEVSGTNEITAYLITGGTATSIGGNIEKWQSVDGGDTWRKKLKVINGRYWCPIFVKDHFDENTKLLICEVNDSFVSWSKKGYLWGDGGFIPNTGIKVTHDVKRVNEGIMILTPTIVPAKYGNGISLPGGATYRWVKLPDSPVFSFTNGVADTPFTMTFWLKSNDTVTAQYIINKLDATRAEWRVDMLNNTMRVLLFKTNPIFIYATAPFTDTTNYNFICVTYDGSAVNTGIKIFINLVEKQDTYSGAGIYTKMTDREIMPSMGNYNGTVNELNGILDEMKFWNAVLSPAEMALVEANDLAW